MLMQVTVSMVEGLKEKIFQVKERYAHHMYLFITESSKVHVAKCNQKLPSY